LRDFRYLFHNASTERVFAGIARPPCDPQASVLSAGDRTQANPFTFHTGLWVCSRNSVVEEGNAASATSVSASPLRAIHIYHAKTRLQWAIRRKTQKIFGPRAAPRTTRRARRRPPSDGASSRAFSNPRAPRPPSRHNLARVIMRRLSRARVIEPDPSIATIERCTCDRIDPARGFRLEHMPHQMLGASSARDCRAQTTVTAVLRIDTAASAASS